MKTPKTPRMPKLSTVHNHDPRECTMCQANAKTSATRTHGYPLGGKGTASRQTGWTPPRDLEPRKAARRSSEPDGYQPGPQHRGQGSTVDRGYSGKHRAYDAKHRRDS